MKVEVKETPTAFVCPTCGRRWERTGRGDSFVRAVARNHAETCAAIAEARHE